MEFKPITIKNPATEINVASNNFSKIMASRQVLKENIRKQICFPKPIVKRHDGGVIYPNTINLIQGKSGVHKSRLVENICCSLLNPVQEYIGFKSTNSAEVDLLYTDTERNINDQLPFALQKIIIGAGFSTQIEVANFDFISLIEIKREERFATLKDYITRSKVSTDKHLVIILDVVTDCIKNFNDPNESLQLVDFLNMMINQFDVTFICVIHENPGIGEKARGHLGTELFNKSTTTIQISFVKDGNQKNTDLIKVAYLKCRSSKNLEPLHLQYDDIIGGLIEVNDDIVRGFADERRSKASSKEVIEILPKFLEKRKSKSELLNLLVSHFDCSTKTLEDRLKELVADETLTFELNGLTHNLMKSKTGSTVYFELIPNNLIDQKLEI